MLANVTKPERELSRLVRSLNSVVLMAPTDHFTPPTVSETVRKTDSTQQYHLEVAVIMKLSTVFHIGYMHEIHTVNLFGA